jgi:hypothetical protein
MALFLLRGMPVTQGLVGLGWYRYLAAMQGKNDIS